MKTYLYRLIFLALITSCGPSAYSGIMELGGSLSYRSSHFDAENYKTSFSTTATLSYYFWEMSALEMSYTNGLEKMRLKEGTAQAYTLLTGFDMLGLDFVLTFAGRQSTFQPYIKLGAANISKEVYREVEGNAKTKISETSGLVPSAGIGFKIKVSQTFSIKVGVDAWISNDESLEDVGPDTLDYAGRAGISWMF